MSKSIKEKYLEIEERLAEEEAQARAAKTLARKNKPPRFSTIEEERAHKAKLVRLSLNRRKAAGFPTKPPSLRSQYTDPDGTFDRVGYNRELRARDPKRHSALKLKHARKFAQENPVTKRLQGRRLRNKKRNEIIAFLGGICAEPGCGFADPRALQLDHINSGGYQQKKAGNETIYKRHKLMRENPEAFKAKYQLLCANHNYIKRDTHDEVHAFAHLEELTKAR